MKFIAANNRSELLASAFALLTTLTVVADDSANQTNIGTQSENGVVINEWSSPVMQGFPPQLGNLVSRENFQETQARLRWGVQHLREKYPTQSVIRGTHPIAVLPRAHRDIKLLKLLDDNGNSTTVGKQMNVLNMDAFIILQEGNIVHEEYFHGMRPSTSHMVFSMEKSLVGSVVATLLGNTKDTLNLQAAIETYVPELMSTAYEGATIRQILNMESSIQYSYIGENPEFGRHVQSVGPAARALGVPVGDYEFIPKLAGIDGRQHGSAMVYKESDPAVLVWACEKITGKSFANIFRKRVWSKLGAEFEIDVQCDQVGHWTYNIALRLRDLARWGQMCLNRGNFNGHQIVPEEFFRDITKNSSVERLQAAPVLGDLMPSNIGYRSYFYHHRPSGAIAAAGAFGQFCYINRRHNVVIAFFSSVDPAFEGEESFARNQREERERWNLCHQMAGLLDIQ